MPKDNPQIHNLRPVYDEWAWQEKANCREVDNSLFFLDAGARGPNKLKKEMSAKKICGLCPVVSKCLSHALSVPEKYGVWGGKSADEREAILAAQEEKVYA